jgi:predicted permease
MGLRPFIGRLLTEDDDRQDSESVAVLTHRFWATSLNGDRSVLGRTIQLGTKNTRIVGVLEPSVPYPTATELIANVVTSPHHLEATMVTKRTHRMTELFGRLAPGATVDSARSELTDLHKEIVRLHPDSYGTNADVQLNVRLFREQLAAPARPILLVLLAAAVIVFVIACSNVANLILARTVRREGELTVRAALGASTGALRRTLLAESLVLCGGGAVLGILLARPLSWLISRYAARFSVRALDVTIDASVLWIAAGLALLAAVALAYLPALPSAHSSSGASPAAGSLRLTPGTNRRLNAFATVQIALSFVLLSGAAMLMAKLVALQSAETRYEMRHVLAIDVPLPFEAYGSKALDFFQTVLRKVEALPAVERTAAGNFVPWRDAGSFGPGFQFAVEGGRTRLAGDDEHAQLRNVTPGFFATVGVPFIAGRDFTRDDRLGSELVVIVSRSVAERMFPDGGALNRRLWWTDPYFGKPVPRRIVGIVEDADDEHVVAEPALLIYHPFPQMPYVNRLFVQTSGDPYGVVAEVRQLIHEVSGDQPVERPATLEDVRAEVLGPQRLNAFVGSAFAGVALVIAVVGVAGVLAFSVSARTREFGLLLAMGSTPARLMAGVLRDGGRIVSIGVALGAAGSYAVGWLAAGYLGVALPPILPVLGAAAVVVAAAVVASLMPAARASHVDVVQALRSE